MKIALSNIDPNPFRDMKRNPVDQNAVKDLVNSFKRNGIWPNVVVRRHPAKKDHFQLAYGHHRLAAMKQHGITESAFIVNRVDEWGMYSAMVDENESGRNLGSAVIYENIEQGILFLEPLVRECETLEEFSKTVPRGTVKAKACDYSRVRNAVLNGKGLGRGFLEHILPGEKSKRPANINAVLKSHYSTMKVEAEEKKAETKRKQKEATQSQEEVDALDKEIRAHEEAAEEAASGGVNKDLLLAFDSAYGMSEFSAAMARHKIPANRHTDAANHITAAGTSAKQLSKEIDKWWDIESGAQAKRFSKAKREADIKKLAKKFGGADINSVVSKFLRATLADWKDLYTVKESVQYLKPKTSDSLHEKLSTMYDELGDLLNALENKPDNVKPITPSEVKRLTQN